MQWTGDFDADGRALFECGECGRVIALGPAEPRRQILEQGDFYASHQAHITLEIFRAASERELWRQASNNREMIADWEQSGGESPFTFGGMTADAA